MTTSLKLASLGHLGVATSLTLASLGHLGAAPADTTPTGGGIIRRPLISDANDDDEALILFALSR